MIYIYDVLLNFVDLDLHYDFYEWKSEDHIEHVKKIPLVKVEKEVMNQILEYEFKIERELLEQLEDLTEVFSKKRIELLPYACIFSDGMRCMAIEFNQEGTSIYHSRMMLDEEEEAIHLCDRMETMEVRIKTSKKLEEKSLQTRLEQEKLNYLKQEIEVTYENKDQEKLSYFYQEYFNKIETDLDTIYQELMNTFTMFHDSHDRLYHLAKLCGTKKQV